MTSLSTLADVGDQLVRISSNARMIARAIKDSPADTSIGEVAASRQRAVVQLAQDLADLQSATASGGVSLGDLRPFRDQLDVVTSLHQLDERQLFPDAGWERNHFRGNLAGTFSNLADYSGDVLRLRIAPAEFDALVQHTNSAVALTSDAARAHRHLDRAGIKANPFNFTDRQYVSPMDQILPPTSRRI